MSDQQQTVPNEVLIQVIAEQRNRAIDEAAELKALAITFNARCEELTAENARLTAEMERLKAENAD